MSDTRPSSRRARQRRNRIGALTAAAALGAGLLIATQLTRQEERPAAPQADPSSTSPRTGPAQAADAVVDDVSPVAGSGAGEQVGLAEAPISLRYTFDGGPDAPVTDTDGTFPLRILTQAGGTLNFAPVAAPDATAKESTRAGGFAMQFPPRCDGAPKSCPRAILEGDHNDALNPGTRPLRYGASVLMNPDDPGDGANVVQKGYSLGGGTQFKLQVDHETAYPSCVVASQSKIYRVEPPIPMADSAWHTLECSRTGNRLAITVDGVRRGAVALPTTLSIANAEPLRIGGKGPGAGNDQFAGQIDNVFLEID